MGKHPATLGSRDPASKNKRQDDQDEDVQRLDELDAVETQSSELGEGAGPGKFIEDCAKN